LGTGPLPRNIVVRTTMRTRHRPGDHRDTGPSGAGRLRLRRPRLGDYAA